MTDKTDIAAMREAAMKATAGKWCTDSQHSVIADAGMNANYYVAACSGPDSQINASFISLANPATIIALLDQLKAERQRGDSETKSAGYWRRAAAQETDRANKAEAELAELRGTQEPDIVARRKKEFVEARFAHLEQFKEDVLLCIRDAMHGCDSRSAPDYAVRVASWLNDDEWETDQHPRGDGVGMCDSDSSCPPRPVVVLPPRRSATSFVDDEFTNADLAAIYNAARLEFKVRMETAGIAVKDGE